MAATATHRVTIPKEMSDLLTGRAKSRKQTLSQMLIEIVEDHIDDEEDRYLSKISEERLATCTKRIPLEEVMRKYDAL